MAKGKFGLSVPPKAVDPALSALFASSVGPAKPRPTSRYAELLPQKSTESLENDDEDEDEEDGDGDGDGDKIESEMDTDGASGDESEQDGSDDGSEDKDDSSDDDDNASDASSVDDEAEAAEVLEAVVSHGRTQEEARKRKRKQRDEHDDLESKYFDRLGQDEEPAGKRAKPNVEAPVAETVAEVGNEVGKKDEDTSMDDEPPVHESIATAANPAATEVEKANRTVFLSNVSVEAITSRTAKKTLLHHLASVLDKKADPPQKVESIRFRSTAFSTAAVPKRAAYIKKEVMEATTKSTNAYVVYSTVAAARLATSQLNGTIVLDRHLRIDSVAHPAPVDNRRCVFVGNLGFVDDETVLNVKVNEDGKQVTQKRKRTKNPMDVEEGLWRVFSKEAGKVESVRVVRDPVTRVGKGFAYVQFYDANAVEEALTLEGKSFPPMLPRTLRVSRCKAPHKTARAMEARTGKAAEPTDRKGKAGKGNKPAATGYVPKPTAEIQTLAGRAGKLLGQSAAAQLTGQASKKDKSIKGEKKDRKIKVRKEKSRTSGESGNEEKQDLANFKKPEDIVFEGRRASAKDGRPKDLRFKGAKKSGAKKRPVKGGRGAIRAAQWKAKGKGSKE